MPVFPDNEIVEMKLNDTDWTDVSVDVVRPVNVMRGTPNNGPTDRLPDIGYITFQMNNSEFNSARLKGYYSPGHTNCRVGFGVGIQVRYRIVYDGQTKTKFYGRIYPDGIDVEPNEKGSRRTNVTVYDGVYQWMLHELELPAYTTNKRIDEVVPLIVANMPIAPLSTSYATGVSTFTSVFDTLKYRTTAYAELEKLALSEPAHIYLKITSASDEVLTVENRNTRSNTTAVTRVVKPKAACGKLKLQTGDYLLLQTEDKLILDEDMAVTFSNNMRDADPTYGKNFANKVIWRTFPKTQDSTNQVLFTLSKEITIEAGATLDLMKINWKNPDQPLARVAALSSVTPTATTDYTMFTATAGGGSDITADLAITYAGGAEGATLVLTNNNAAKGYVNFLQVRGKGVYFYDPVDTIYEDSTTQATYGIVPLTYEAKYQEDPTVAALFGSNILNYTKTIRQSMDYVTFDANSSAELLGAFFATDIGDMVNITEDQSAVGKDFFIQGIAFESTNGASDGTYAKPKITFTWYLKDAEQDRIDSDMYARYDVSYYDQSYYGA